MKTHRITQVVSSALLILLLGVVMRARAAPIGNFTQPRQVPGLESDFHEFGSSISSDGKTIYFASNRALEPPAEGPATFSKMDLYQATWDDANERFINVEPLDDINTDGSEYSPTISSDGRTLYFVSNRPDGEGDQDLWQTTRESIDATWGTPTNLGPQVNSAEAEAGPNISSDNLTIYFHKGAGESLWSASRTEEVKPFEDAMPLDVGEGTGAAGGWPNTSTDGLTLFFGDNRTGGKGGLDLWVSTRGTIGDSFGEPVNLNDFGVGSEVNSPFGEVLPDIATDWPIHGSKLYYTIAETTGSPFGASDWDIYESTWIVSLPGDFDGSGLLDTADIDLLSDAVRAGNNLIYDLDGNGVLDQVDRSTWVEDLFGTFFGDADLDKEVAFADFLSLSNQFSESGGWASGDFDGNGQIQFPDFLMLSTNFGKSASAVAAVPEPSTAMLLLVGLVGLVRRRGIASETPAATW